MSEWVELKEGIDIQVGGYYEVINVNAGEPTVFGARVLFTKDEGLFLKFVTGEHEHPLESYTHIKEWMPSDPPLPAEQEQADE